MGWCVLEDQRVCPVSDLDLLNGHEWAERQCEEAGIGYTALDNGFRDCTGPRALQQPRRSRDARGSEVARHL